MRKKVSPWVFKDLIFKCNQITDYKDNKGSEKLIEIFKYVN